jgi:hypothetical protein
MIYVKILVTIIGSMMWLLIFCFAILIFTKEMYPSLHHIPRYIISVGLVIFNLYVVYVIDNFGKHMASIKQLLRSDVIQKFFDIALPLLKAILGIALFIFAFGLGKYNWFPELNELPRMLIIFGITGCAIYMIYLDEEEKKKDVIKNKTSQIQQNNSSIKTELPATRDTIAPLYNTHQTHSYGQTNTPTQSSTYNPTYFTPKPLVYETEAEKAKKQLDNYWRKRKSKEEIGRDYERYIGWTYEDAGYKVQYNGIEKKLEDGGIDLICFKGNKIDIVQCKNWAKEKIVHEKHINQLYGAFQSYKIEYNISNSIEAKAIFVTSAEASPTARKVANNLVVELNENLHMDKTYPCIKCNLSSTGEKIYHLPFDGQYDRTKITKKGECYVRTVEEAEQMGFRRAN